MCGPSSRLLCILKEERGTKKKKSIRRAVAHPTPQVWLVRDKRLIRKTIRPLTPSPFSSIQKNIKSLVKVEALTLILQNISFVWARCCCGKIFKLTMLQEREKMATMGWRYASSKYNNISWSGHALILSKRSSKALQSSVLFCLVRTKSHCGVCCLCVVVEMKFWSWLMLARPPNGQETNWIPPNLFHIKIYFTFPPEDPPCQWQSLTMSVYNGCFDT